ncbi:hypothetical protein OB919_11575 [Halobacteria archaeon AArc-curdl1]|uniref:Uncharacterized protein n=1 Tax=Natronosalvus hydrolyticus TaxID=2979988 RepID=A0AAP3E747_9EURY|nr:hypothetical protein [Halobacteria archaeon AArc-curdl1]
MVLRTARKDDNVEITDESNYQFDTNYELFTAGLVIGFLRDDPRTESKGSYSQDFIQVNRVGGSSENEYREGIEFIYKLIELEHSDDNPDDSELWELALQYADAGVEALNQDISLKGEFDLLAFIDEADQKWEDRLEDVLISE